MILEEAVRAYPKTIALVYLTSCMVFASVWSAMGRTFLILPFALLMEIVLKPILAIVPWTMEEMNAMCQNVAIF